MILDLEGYDARGFVSAEEVLAAPSPDNPPDLLITDVMMGQINGIDLAIRFKTNYPNCKVILFSGNIATGNLLSDAHLHGHDFIVLAKPVHPRILLELVARLLQ